MERIFIYKKKSGMSIWPTLVFTGIAVYCGVFKYGLAFKRFTFLDYPNSAIVTGLIAVAFGVSYFLQRKKAQDSAANPDTIVTSETGFRYTISKKGEFVVAYADVKELYHKESEDGVSSIVYTCSNKRFEWFEESFDSPSAFAEFEKILEQNCVNITNR